MTFIWRLLEIKWILNGIEMYMLLKLLSTFLRISWQYARIRRCEKHLAIRRCEKHYVEVCVCLYAYVCMCVASVWYFQLSKQFAVRHSRKRKFIFIFDRSALGFFLLHISCFARLLPFCVWVPRFNYIALIWKISLMRPNYSSFYFRI